MDRTSLLQALRLKGVAPGSALVEALGAKASEIESRLSALEVEGLVQALPRGVRLTEPGHSALACALATERAGLERTAFEQIYQRFDAINGEFKRIVTDWQLRDVEGDQKLNDHSDPDYDRAVIERFEALHDRLAPLADAAGRHLPRLAVYAFRFARARDRVADGDPRYLAAPMIDSYHTVWFEFHEELLQASGRSRAEEAAAGRAD